MQLVKAKRVITSVGDEVLDQGAVLVDEGKIVAVGKPAELEQHGGGGHSIIDLGDKTLLPGLFDCHVHLGFDGGPDPVKVMMSQSDEEQLILMLHSAKELLRAGVTTARDLGARGHLGLYVRDAINNGMADGPELLVANQPVTPTGGHCWFMGGEVDGRDEIQKAVRERHKAGADLVKVMATGGNMTRGSMPWLAQFTLEEMQVLVNEARRLNMRVAAHAHGTPGIKNAAEAGVTTIEHCSFQTEGGFMSGDGYDPKVVETIVKNGCWVSSTINGRLLDPAASSMFTPAMRESRAKRLMDMKAAGAKFIISTDCGINNTPHGIYGGGLVVRGQYGFTPREIIKAATIDAAEACDLKDRKGSLEAGKDADLVAFDGNPLEDLTVFQSRPWVMARGKAYDFAANPA